MCRLWPEHSHLVARSTVLAKFGSRLWVWPPNAEPLCSREKAVSELQLNLLKCSVDGIISVSQWLIYEMEVIISSL